MTYDISQVDLAYLAGLIDGEGWVGLCRRKRSWKPDMERSYYLRPVISIDMMKRECLDKVHKALGVQVEQVKREGYIYRLRLYPSTLRWLCPLLLPHLVLKRRQAEIIIEFLSVSYKGKELSVEEMFRRELLYREMKSLNEKPAATRRRLAQEVM